MKTLFVVEDNPDNQLLLQAMIGRSYHLVEFDDGPAALDRLSREIPDLVLLDISLPGMNGMEVLEQLRALPGGDQVPVIALTAHAMKGDEDRFLSSGFDRYIAKPIIDKALLVEAIEVLLERGRKT